MMHWPELKEGDFIPYQKTYLDRVPEGDIISILVSNMQDTLSLLRNLDIEKQMFRYAPDKWTIKEVVCHMIDTERIMCYRALCIARGEQQMLPGFEENDYVKASHANERDFGEMLKELDAVRNSTITLIESFTPDMIITRGNANKHTITVNALCKVIAGHELHHMAIIRERYLKN